MVLRNGAGYLELKWLPMYLVLGYLVLKHVVGVMLERSAAFRYAKCGCGGGDRVCDCVIPAVVVFREGRQSAIWSLR